MDGNIMTFRLHYGGILVREPVTKYRDYDYVNMKREENRVCMWSFTTELRNLGFKDCDVNGVYYKQPSKTLKDGLRLIHDEASLYDMFSCASRTGLIELYVDRSEEWLRTNNKLVDTHFTVCTNDVTSSCDVGEQKKNGSGQSLGVRYNDKSEESEEDGTSSKEDNDPEINCELELEALAETLDTNQDTELVVGIDAVKEHYRTLNQTMRKSSAKIPRIESQQGNEGEDNFQVGEENYLDNSNVDSLNEEILEDGTTEMRRTVVRLPRYNENCRTVWSIIS